MATNTRKTRKSVHKDAAPSLDDNQAEVDDIAQALERALTALRQAESCETVQDFRANLVEAFAELDAALDEMRGLARCDTCNKVYCDIMCPRACGM